MAIADDYAAIARAMRRNTWKANKIASFRCDAPARVPADPGGPRFFAVDLDKPAPVDITSIAAWLHHEITGTTEP